MHAAHALHAVSSELQLSCVDHVHTSAYLGGIIMIIMHVELGLRPAWKCACRHAHALVWSVLILESNLHSACSTCVCQLCGLCGRAI